jgi:hypothetical protein
LEAIFNALFSRAASMKEHRVEQLQLFEELTVRDFHRRWDEAARREKETQTRFAQRAIKPEEVERELRETDAVLGDPGAVARFVLNACQRLNLRVEQNRDGTITIQGDVPAFLKDLLPKRPVTFNTPAPEGTAYLGRNHPFVAALARYLLEAALTQGSSAPAARCGVIKTAAVARRTVLLLLRLRYLLEQPEREKELLAEEVVVAAFQGFPPDRLTWLSDTEALGLLENLHPDAAVTSGERREVLSEVLGWWPELKPGLERLVTERARKLEDAHRRVRAAAHLVRRGLAVRPQFPPDLIGLLILLPVPKGVKR